MSDTQVSHRITGTGVETLVKTGRYTTSFVTVNGISAAHQIALCHYALEQRDEEIKSLTARLAAAEAALEPFVRIAKEIPAHWNGRAWLTISDIRGGWTSNPQFSYECEGVKKLPYICEWRATIAATKGGGE